MGARQRRIRRGLQLLQLAMGGVVVGMLLAACTTGSSPSSLPRSSGTPSTSAARQSQSESTSPSSTSATEPPASSSSVASTPVHIQLKFSDGQTFGVGIPVIAFFSKKITDATALQEATTLTINGVKASGGRWYFEPVEGHPGYPIEGDYRMQDFWPSHANVFVDIPAKGLSAGAGLAYDDSLTSTFSTGASQVAIVDNVSHTLALTVDGKPEGTYPVSLGATQTPTSSGTKVIMEKGVSICMSGPGYHECGVKYTQRLTYGGEYLHSAPWNCTGAPGCVGPQNNIGHGNSSNGCTNLLPTDAAKLYGILRVGDVVRFPDADGPKMTMGAGYGDWNVPWVAWMSGGDVAKI